MIGWLLDTNLVSTIINPNGAPTVKTWAATQDEDRFFFSILTLGEYRQGHPQRAGRPPQPAAVHRRPGRAGGTGLPDGSCRSATRLYGGGVLFRERPSG
jgi:hypothetical protein